MRARARAASRGGGGLKVLGAAALAALLGAVGVFHVWSRTRVTDAGYELARLETEHRRLASERDRLRIEVATLRAPGRLEQFARVRLGMAPPAPDAVVAGVGVGTGWAAGVGGGASRRAGPAEPVVVLARTAAGRGRGAP